MLMFLIPREELRMKCKNLFYPPGLYKVMKITFKTANTLKVDSSSQFKPSKNPSFHAY